MIFVNVVVVEISSWRSCDSIAGPVRSGVFVCSIKSKYVFNMPVNIYRLVSGKWQLNMQASLGRVGTTRLVNGQNCQVQFECKRCIIAVGYVHPTRLFQPCFCALLSATALPLLSTAAYKSVLPDTANNSSLPCLSIVTYRGT